MVIIKDLVYYGGLTLVVAIVAVILLLRLCRAPLYDAVIVKMTAQWYREVLTRLDDKESLLDVGIGTGSALLRNKDIILEKKLQIMGVDYDNDYVLACQQHFDDAKLSKQCSVIYVSVYDYQGPKGKGNKFDSAYFSGSLMIMPDAALALSKVKTLLKKGGKIYVTQTFQHKHIL